MSASPIAAQTPRAFSSVDEFYAHALGIEIEAGERYVELAEQMEMHGNREVGALFRRLAEIELKHADQIRARAGAAAAAACRTGHRWLDPAGPETTAYEETHYLVTPYHALLVALHNEERAAAFFLSVARATTVPAIRDLAQEMAADEEHHVALVRAWIDRFPQPADG